MSEKAGEGVRDWWRLGAVVAAVGAFVVGVIGLAMSPAPMSLPDKVYGVLQLFVLTDDRIGSPPANVLLEIARFVAPATTAYAVFEALRALMRGELRRRRLARRRGHVIVCGDDAAAVMLAQALSATATARVVLISAASGGDGRDAAFDAVVGDPRDAAMLRAAGVAGATALYACAKAPDTNAAVVLAAAQERSAPGGRFYAFAEVGDDELVEALRVRQLSGQPTPRTMIDFFALEETAARAVVADSGLSAGDPVAIVGDGSFGLALIRALVRVPATDGVRRSVVVHTDAGARVAETAARLGVAEHGLDLVVRGLDDPLTGHAERIFVCQPGEDKTIGLAVRLLRTPGRRVVACLRRGAPFDAALRDTGGLRVVGILDEGCRPDRIAADAVIGRAARAIHDRYVQERRAAGDTAATNAAVCAWDELPAHLQESNYAQAEHIGDKLRTIDAVLTTVPPAEPFRYRPGEVDRLARLEHKRWTDERRAAGFVWGPSRAGNQHPDLLDWPDLSAESRQKDIEVVEYLPELLAGAGLFITRIA